MKRLRDALQAGIYKVINPLVRFLIRIGLTPNMVTLIGLVLNIGVAVILVAGAEQSHRGELSYIGWAGALTLFAGLFDMLDGQVARMGNMSSSYGALFDSVLDRYSEMILFLGICYYLVAHHYFLSSLCAFIALIGSMMVSYTRARAEGLGVACKGGLMQRPERVVLISLSAIACGVTAHFIGGDYKLYIPGLPFHVFETMSIFTFPIAIMAVLTNITAIGRLREAKQALMQKEAEEVKRSQVPASRNVHVISTLVLILCSVIPAAAHMGPDKIQVPVLQEADTFPVPPAEADRLFYLQRTPNTNTIVYDLNRRPDGTVDDEHPVHVYWIRYTEPGHPKKELNFIQRRYAYGVKVRKQSAGSWDLRLVSYDKIPVFLRRTEAGNYYAVVRIRDTWCVFRKAYIKIDGGSFWKPNVLYIELSGTDMATGALLTERVKPAA